MADHKMWIGGDWFSAASGETFPTFNPATGKEIARIPLAGKTEVDKAVAAARAAYPGWSRTSQADRSAFVRRIGKAIEDNLDELARLETLEHGTPVNDTTGAIMSSVDNLEYAASTARSFMGNHIPAINGTLTYLRREPVGVCGLITPWNHALGMMAVKLGQALVTGNTCVIKPPSVNSLIGLKFAKLLESLELPDGVANIITGPGSSVGEALVTHPDVDLIGFTGSSETGKCLMAAGSRTLKKFIMELGGNNPVIILDDADVEAAVNYHAPRQYHNAGQHCSGAGRYYVHEAVYDRFMELFIDTSQNIVMGDPADKNTFLGPVASREHRDRLENYIISAMEDGAVRRLGGKRPNPPMDRGFFIPPTIFSDVTENMVIAREEIFGPIAVIMKPFTSQDDVIAKANDTRYGLTATVWTEDSRTGLKFVDKLHAGTVNINTQVLTPELPWGGFKESGFGKEGSIEGLLGYTQVKMVCMKYA